MKHLMYGSVSAFALLLALHGAAKADATLSTSVTLTAANPALGVLVDSANAIDDLSFFAAAGAFQVQQNNSVNSSASQNAAIDARSLNHASIGVGQLNTALSANLNTVNTALGVLVLSLNRITNDSFDAASGQFQVQQNQAVNSTTGQNSAITALVDSGAGIGALQAGVAAASNTTTYNNASDTAVINTNAIDDSFEGASGVFQIQQNASINSSTQQNVAVSSVADPGGAVSVSQVSLAAASAAVTDNRSYDNTVASSNQVNPDSFLAASGVFQVQQSNSINSAATQNMAVGAVDAGLVFTGNQLALADLDAEETGNISIGDLVAASNRITGSFQDASGAFQVQQNNSINSAASQNMAVAAVTAGAVVPLGSQTALADLDSVVAGNVALGDAVFGSNVINGASFAGASGMFQVQQNNSINSAVSQNMAVSAITTGH
jgi:hypothetical protein